MTRTIFTLLLLGAFVISVQAKDPVKKNNVEQAVRFQVIQNTRTVQLTYNFTRTRTSSFDLRTRTLVDNSSAQIKNLGDGNTFGLNKSNSQIENLGNTFGLNKSNVQVENLGDGNTFGLNKSNSQIENLGNTFGLNKSNVQVENLGDGNTFGLNKSNSQIENLGNTFGLNK